MLRIELDQRQLRNCKDSTEDACGAMEMSATRTQPRHWRRWASKASQLGQTSGFRT
jgi:hypothetical protein